MDRIISRKVPERHGKRWENDEDDFILKRIKEGAFANQIAHEVKRTTGSIISRLKGIAYNRVKSGEEIQAISELTGLTVEDIQEHITLKDTAEQMRQQRSKTLPHSQTRPFFLNKTEETELDVLRDIRDLLREVVTKLNTTQS